jgi:hypothetical protein
MGYNKSCLSVGIPLNCCLWKWPWVTYWASGSQKIRIHYPYFFLLKNSIKMFENLSSDQFVISVDNNEQFLRFTIFICCHSQIRHSHSSFFISYESKLWFINVLLFEVFFHVRSSSIIARIINKNYVVILIVLLENWIHIMKMSIILSIVICWNDHTNRYLLICTNFVFFFVVVVLYFG